MKQKTQERPEKNFLDFIEEARKGPEHEELEQWFNDIRSEKDLKPEELRELFQKKGFGGITVEDCIVILRIAKRHSVDFHQQPKY